jgi:imidazolonepropionase-like amidohydrolase
MCWDTLKTLISAGVHVCIITDHSVIPLQYLPVCAALAFKAGLSREDALKCITLYGAEHIGMEDRMGSLEEGKDADMVLWSGDPLDSRSEALVTIIDGKVVYSKEN